MQLISLVYISSMYVYISNVYFRKSHSPQRFIFYAKKKELLMRNFWKEYVYYYPYYGAKNRLQTRQNRYFCESRGRINANYWRSYSSYNLGTTFITSSFIWGNMEHIRKTDMRYFKSTIVMKTYFWKIFIIYGIFVC